MDFQKKSIRVGVLFLGLLCVAGLLLLYEGNDAVALALKKKEGILTAEQVRVSFDSVSGRMIDEAVQEAQEVKRGDVLMVLDSTDVDLSIAKLQKQIAQAEAQLRSLRGAIRVGYTKMDVDEQQNFRQIDQQRAAVDSAKATYANRLLDYNRKAALLASGAISQSELDDARTSLDVAAANEAQQRQLFAKLLAGIEDSGNTDALRLPTIEQARAELANQQHDVENLEQYKNALEVERKELQVRKEGLTLCAPEDGKILKIIAKQGEMVAANTPVILLESKRYYYDLYLSEKQAALLSEGAALMGRTVATEKEVPGAIRLIAAAPGFADLKMSREKGQADLSAFQVRVYTQPQAGLLPGMTIEVTEDAFAQR